MKAKALSLLLCGITFYCQGQITIESGKDTDSTAVSKLTISGYADTYYQYNLNNPSPLGGNLGTTGAGRVLDIHHNQFVLNLLQTKFAFESDQIEVVLEPVFGPGAELGNYGNSATSLSIKQAYAAYSFSDKLKLTAGQYGTHIGLELVDAYLNFHYSIDYLMGNGPIYHTGVKLDYQPSEKFALMAGVVNGWDMLLDNNPGKSLAATAKFMPSDKAFIALNWIGGDEDPSLLTGDTVSSYKHMFDILAPFTFGDRFHLTLNGAYGWYNFGDQPTKNWGGAAVYMDYDFTKKFALGFRFEYLDDTPGAQNLGATVFDYTLTGVIKAANDHIYFKPEVRMDTSSQDIYFTATGLSNTQTTLGLGIIGVF